MSHRQLIVLAALAVLSIPSLAQANARLISVVPTDGGCVSGPTGASVQFWDVEPGRTYELTISNVTECANGGTGPTINVRVNSSTGNTDLVATLVVPSTYKFTYTLPANVDLNERNTTLAWGGELSKKMNFAKEDAADDLLLNEVIWRSIRGAHSPMPAPVRAAFVFTHGNGDDGDD